MPLITVIVPAYNVEKYLPACLDSILNQTYADWRCFVMDDGSTDRTLAIAESYAGKDGRFRVSTQENKGLAKTYNALIDLALADGGIEYLYICDSDDFIHPSTFEVFLGEMSENGADLVEGGVARASAEDALDVIRPLPARIEREIVTDFDVYWSKETARGMWINKWNKLHRWEKISQIRFDERLTNEDDFWYETLVHHAIGKKVILHAPFYYYRRNPTSSTNTLRFETYVRSGIRVVDLRWKEYVKTGKVPEAYRAAFKKDLAEDAFRIVLQKNLKKNRDAANRRFVFGIAAAAIEDMIREGKIEPARLGFARRLTIWAARRRCHALARIGARLASI